MQNEAARLITRTNQSSRRLHWPVCRQANLQLVVLVYTTNFHITNDVNKASGFEPRPTIYDLKAKAKAAKFGLETKTNVTTVSYD